MKKILKFLLYYALIPFAASLPGFVLGMFGTADAVMLLVPVIAAGIYILFRKKLDMRYAASANGLITFCLLIAFTLSMLFSSGNADSLRMSVFRALILPFSPLMLILTLMDRNMTLFVTALLTYAAAFAVTAWLGRLPVFKKPKAAVPCLVISLVCVTLSTCLYMNRPSVKYGGHGFEYMHGFSSTDFTDYTVYSPDSKLVTPDSPVSLMIENEDDMPVLDGAEACYPLYAAFAKAVYRDIDVIEKNWLETAADPSANGRIVTFTNTVRGFDRLLWGAAGSGMPDGIDMFFGARPSESQLWEAGERGVELTVTPIGREAFVFFTEADNPVDDLTADQLRAIYHGDLTNWSSLGGNDQEIRAFQRPKNSGSQTMMEYFMGDVSLKEPLSYEKVSAMDGVIRQVAQYADEDGAIGYSFRYFVEELAQETGVKLLAVDGVYPSLESIEDGTYPLTVDVCVITRKDDPNPYVQQMIDFILSDAGQEIVRETGYGRKQPE